jgi:HD-GYP domain-containing protein (c-di-GMP phosphodiesterase class II)
MSERAARAPDALHLQRLILAIVQAVSNSALYPVGHPKLREAVAGLVERLEALLEERRQHQVTLVMMDDDLLVDQRPYRQAGLHLKGFIHTMRRLGVEGLTLARGLDAAECERFLAAIAELGKAVSTEHLVVGRVKLAFTGDESDDAGREDGRAGTGGGGEGRGDLGDAAGGGGPGDSGSGDGGLGSGPGGRGVRAALSSAELDHAREAFARFRTDPRAGLAMMEALVWSFIDALARTTELLFPLARLRDHDELTYVHSVNVSLLVLAQARAYGFRGELLKEIGLGALLHDLGKLSLPPALLNKVEPLSAEEWRQVQRHPELGATQLLALDPETRIPALVAFEHHLRYDQLPSYPTLRAPRQPILATAMTSVADTFDALQTARPYARSYSRPAALAILRERAGTYLDPLLAESFCRLFEDERPASR